MVCAKFLRYLCAGVAAATFATAGAAPAHAAANRIQRAIDARSEVALPGTANPLTRAGADLGAVEANRPINGITMYFRPSIGQQAALEVLLQEQQNPASPNYHKWLTPAEFANRFGMSDSDLAKVTQWLQQQGFTVDRVANSRTSITFSGTAAQVAASFHSPLHRYLVGGETHFANSSALTIPSALSGVVTSVRNLNDFRPKAMVRPHNHGTDVVNTRPKANFTSSTSSGNHFMQPGDVDVVYDVNAAYHAGYTGTGQSIAVVGQSAVSVSDIEAFQSAAGLPTKDPTMVLRPGSGAATVSSGDESESDLDLEYSGAIAKNATIYFVYVGNGTNYSVWDSLQYAVDTRIAPIISMSYGACEPDMPTSDFNTLEAILQQAASQGQSVIVSSGDDGSTSCYADVTSATQTVTTAEKALAVNYPASSSYVTAMGGTEFPTTSVASSNTTYWDSASGSDVVTSAKSYIPEQVWNDDDASYAQYGLQYVLSAGGGGVSTFSTTNSAGTAVPNKRPSWQTGVPGISTAPDYSKNMRLLPDISLDSSPNNAGYLYCTSDSASWSSGQEASCNDGFRDSATGDLTVAGGTSFAAPIFAGMLAILNQKENSTGQGVINTALYSLAANSSTYASAFHDVINGGNQCTAGTTYCSTAGAANYAATTGYDEASGLGSIDLYNLMNAWTASSSALLAPTTTSLTAASSTPLSGASDAITIKVGPQASTITTTPTGTVTLTVDDQTISNPLTLANGSASYTFSSTTTGSHVITATYSGDSAFAPSTGTVVITVSGATFTLSATNVTAKQGSSGTSTVTIKSQNSYAGTVTFALSVASTSSLAQNGCYSLDDTSVAANSTATATLTIYTDEADCSSTSSATSALHNGRVIRHFTPGRNVSQNNNAPLSHRGVRYSMAALAGLFLVGSFRRRSRLMMGMQCLVLLGMFGLFTGCGGGSSSSGSSSDSSGSTTDVAKGTYSVTLDGTDTADSTIDNNTTLTVTVD